MRGLSCAPKRGFVSFLAPKSTPPYTPSPTVPLSRPLTLTL